MAKGSGSGPTREQGKRAGANAPATPLHRLRWPNAMESRLKAAGIQTKPKFLKK